MDRDSEQKAGPGRWGEKDLGRERKGMTKRRLGESQAVWDGSPQPCRGT